MPQYLLSVCHDEPYADLADLDLTDPDIRRQQAQIAVFATELERQGVWVFTAGLRDASSATVVRARGGEVSMTDGPYAETKEQVGGFWIIEAADRTAALEWAGRAAAACERPIEVRAVEGG